MFVLKVEAVEGSSVKSSNVTCILYVLIKMYINILKKVGISSSMLYRRRYVLVSRRAS